MLLELSVIRENEINDKAYNYTPLRPSNGPVYLSSFRVNWHLLAYTAWLIRLFVYNHKHLSPTLVMQVIHTLWK